MRITFVTPGSRGDVQPYVALGKGLISAGFKVKLVSSKNHELLVSSNGLEFCPIEVSTEDFIRSEKMRAVLEGGKLLKSMAKMGDALKNNAELITKRTLDACVDANLIIAGVSGLFTAHSVSQKLNLPFLQAYNLPLTPTSAFPGVLLPNFPRIPGGYKLSHLLTRQILWQTYRPIDKIARSQVLGLPTYPIMGPFGSANLDKMPIIYGFSPSVIPQPKDWGSNVRLTGFWFLDSPDDLTPTREMENFVESGSPPFYVGFGSMSNKKPEETANIIFNAFKIAGRRAIVYSGWGGIEKIDVPDNILMVNSAPHSWLFPRCAAVIHHGGAGTTAAGLRGGIPSIIIPHHGDQPFWANLVAKLGVGPKPIARSKLTAGLLVKAINEVQIDRQMQTKAAEMGTQIRKESGVKTAIEIICKYF